MLLIVMMEVSNLIKSLKNGDHKKVSSELGSSLIRTSVTLKPRAGDIVVSENIAYFAYSEHKLLLYNVSDPQNAYNCGIFNDESMYMI